MTNLLSMRLLKSICLVGALATGGTLASTAAYADSEAISSPTGRTFEHKCRELHWKDVLEESNLAPDLGEQGWELATLMSAIKPGGFSASTRIVACFKRETTK